MSSLSRVFDLYASGPPAGKNYSCTSRQRRFKNRSLKSPDMVATREEEKNYYGLGAAPGGDESTSAEGRANPLARASFPVPFQHKF